MKKSVKSVLAVLLAAAMVVASSACKKSEDTDEKEKEQVEETAEKGEEEDEEEEEEEEEAKKDKKTGNKDKKGNKVKMVTKRTADDEFADNADDFEEKLGKILDLSKYKKDDASEDKVTYKIFTDQDVNPLDKNIYLEDGTHIVLPMTYDELKEQGWSAKDEDKMIENRERGWLNSLESLYNRYDKAIYLLADNRDREEKEVKLSDSSFAIIMLTPYDTKSVKKGDEYQTVFAESDRSPAFVMLGGISQYSGIEEVVSVLGDPTSIEFSNKDKKITVEYRNIPEWDEEIVIIEFGTYFSSLKVSEINNNCIGKIEFGK